MDVGYPRRSARRLEVLRLLLGGALSAGEVVERTGMLPSDVDDALDRLIALRFVARVEEESGEEIFVVNRLAVERELRPLL